MNTQKLGKNTDQRKAMLRGLVTDFLMNGKLETTYDRAKATQRLAERYITIAINSYEDVVTETKTTTDSKGKEKQLKVTHDGAKKLAARRRLIAKLYNKPEPKVKGEKKASYKKRVREIKYPVIEKLFEDYAPKFAKRAKEVGKGGGYTRVLKTTIRRGDNAQLAILELIDVE